MTDRIHSVTVVLDKDYRDDDLEALMTALKMLKGVIAVEPHVADPVTMMAYARARHDLSDKIWEVLYPKKG